MTSSSQVGAGMPNEKMLMDVLQFTQQDLLANREGHLSERQRQYLTIDRQKNMILGVVVIGILVFAVTGLLYLGIDRSNRLLQIFGLILLFCNMGASWVFAVNWIRMTYDLRTNTIDVVEGTTQHVVRKVGSAKAASVRVGDRVEVPAENIDQFTAFAPGTTYRLYRTSHTHRLLSVEQIGQ